MDAESGGHPPANGPGPDSLDDPARTVILDVVPELAFGSSRRRRCVALLPGVSGVDTTATAAGLALALASALPSDVLLLDVGSSGGALSSRFGVGAAVPGAMLPVAPGLTYRPTDPAELSGHPWPSRYGLLLVHCGPDPSRDVLETVLDAADQALLLTPDCAAGVESARAALDWLHASGHAHLAGGAVVALAADTSASPVAVSPLMGRCRRVCRLPVAAHAAAPGVVDPAVLPDAALDALQELAREVTSA